MDIVVYDLEYTSWEGALERNWSGPGEHREVVQIGAVRLSGETGFPELASFERIVVPRINRRLSAYFTDLTGIGEDRLRREGIDFEAALAALVAFARRAAALISNGGDEGVLRENCRLYGLAWPFPDGFCRDVSPIIRRAAGSNRHIVSADLPRVLGYEQDGPAHDGLADARAVAAALRRIGRIEP